MDLETRTFRTRVVNRLLIRVGLELAVLLGALLMAAAATGRLRDPGDVALAILAAEVLMAVRVVAAVETNPLNRRFLAEYSSRPFAFGSIPRGELHPVAEALLGRGLQHVGAVGERGGDPSLEYDVFQAPSRLVTAAVARAAGSVEYLTKLSDDRILHSSALLVLPNAATVVNPCPAESPDEMLASHLRAVQRLESIGVSAVAGSPSVFLDAFGQERRAFREVGPVVGSFLDLTWQRFRVRLMVRVPPGEIREAAFDRGAVVA